MTVSLSREDLADRTKDFTGRDWVLDALESWLATSTDRAFVLVGDPGTGKSAIAARLVQMGSGEVQPDGHRSLSPGFLFHAHFCRANDPASIRPLGFVASLSSHLGTAFEPCREAIEEF